MRAYRTAVLVAMIAGIAGCAAPQQGAVSTNASGDMPMGVYGRVDVRPGAVPPLVDPEPMIIAPLGQTPAPVYMHLPPVQVEKWSMFCHRYHACNAPVYFVKSKEYEAELERANRAKRDNRYRESR